KRNVARGGEGAPPPVFERQGGEPLESPVLATVVGEQDFVIVTILELCHHRPHTLAERTDIVLLVIDGNQNADKFARGHRIPVPPCWKRAARGRAPAR